MNTAFDSISIKIASPDQIKDSSKQTSCRRRNPADAADGPFICPEKGTCNCGEVKKAETINYRSFRPEPEGLFCEAIFGPQKDWECNCGKYKRIKHKGIICDRCGVEVTQQRVRRERLGYIQLAAPVSHIWYFKGIPSRIGTFCELSSRQVELVLYFDAFIVVEVTDPDCPLEPRQVLTEIEYLEYSSKYRGGFRAGTGAEVIREILSGIDLEEEIKRLTQILEETTSQQKKLKVAKQLKQIAEFAEVGQRPEWMILDVIPVIPPDLRPLVPLEGGRFATSDLNDLYRRVINRNNRLRKLIQLRSPEVILRNEKRMLQEAVDAFFDNGRHGRRVTGPGNRPLKSLADVLKGKIGRFRQNLLGKRVDYSGRSVIVVGPELGLHQCGIPKRMAVELFKPFIIERLQAHNHAQTIKRAKHFAEQVDPDSPVWDVVEEVIADHPVLLNRPPTLHRLGIQAFLPVLVEGKSIRIPPLVCKAFNADFDGDQMAVHVPLTVEAQAEAKMLMLSSHNILKPSHGAPIAVPELDMVLGPSFLTKTLPGHAEDAALLHAAYTTDDESALDALRDKSWYHRRYAHPEEVIAAHVAGQLKLHDNLQFFCAHSENGGKATEPVLTTVGRIIFNEVLPSELEWEDEHSHQRIPFFNGEAGGRRLSEIVDRCFNELGTRVTTEVLEKIQKLAFEYATLSGISPGIADYLTPENRNELVDDARTQIDTLLEGTSATEREEYENEQIRIWFDAMDKIEEKMFDALPKVETPLVERGDPRKVHPEVDPHGSEISDKTIEGFSPVHIMADSGARARKNPFMQISAFIGLKAKQDGNILIPPIGTSAYRGGDQLPNYFCSYREGLDVIDYFNSTYGSRKGLVDTAMKTAASGYLTRKLVDVAQDVRVTLEDCGTLNSIQKFATAGGDLAFKINGRITAENVLHPETGDVLVPADTLISVEMAEQIDGLGVKVVKVRSVLTCEAEEGVCAKCYGHDLTTNNLVNVGEAVGIIAAQSIGEPGTQLTMRTFHTGGAVEDVSEARQDQIFSTGKNVEKHKFDISREDSDISKNEKKVPVVRARLKRSILKVRRSGNGVVRFRDFIPGRTVTREEGSSWADDQASLRRTGRTDVPWKVIQSGYSIDKPAYKVMRVNHPDCPLREGELLSEKQYIENTERYKGFDTKAWLYEVTEVSDNNCDLEGAQYKKIDDKGVGEPESEFEESVRDFLVEKGYKVTTQVKVDTPKGRRKFRRIDMAVNVDNKEATYRIGIECDGPYHEDPGQPEKDKERQRELEKLGWKFHRIPHRDWHDNPQEAQQNLLETVEKAVKEDQVLWRKIVVGDQLSQAEYAKAQEAYGFQRFAKLHYRVTNVHHPDVPLNSGDLLTADDVERLTAEIQRGFDGEWHYLDSETDARLAAESLSETGTVDASLGGKEGDDNFKRVYRVTEKTNKAFPFNVGDEVPTEDITPWLTPFEVDAKPVYVMTEEIADAPALLKQTALSDEGATSDVPPLTVGQMLTEREFAEARTQYKQLERAFKVERQESERYYVTHVHHLDCPFEVGDELTKAEEERGHRRYPGFEAPPLRHRVMQVYHPDCSLKPGQLLTENEKKHFSEIYQSIKVDAVSDGAKSKQNLYHVTAVHHPKCPIKVDDVLTQEEVDQLGDDYPGVIAEETSVGSFEAEKLSRVTAVNHSDCPLQLGDLLTSKELSTDRREYKAFEVVRLYEVTSVEKLSSSLVVGQRLTETEYRALCKKDSALKDCVTSQYRVLSVHHPRLTLEVGAYLTAEEQKKYQRDFKGLDVETVYRVISDKREVDKPHAAGDILSRKDYNSIQKVTYAVTEINNPRCEYEVGRELSENVYKKARKQYPGFDVQFLYHGLDICNPNCEIEVGDIFPEGEYKKALMEYPAFEVGEIAPQMHIEIVHGHGKFTSYRIPEGYTLSVKDRDKVKEDDVLAEQQERTANSDIVAGIPRVTELFEARRPKNDDAAEIAEIEGYVRPAGTKNGVPSYRIEHEGYESRLYPIPDEKRRVAEGDWVDAGDSLTDGNLNPHDILRIGRTAIEGVSVEGEEAVWAYLVDEVQKVYGEGTINDKHVETIVRQMLTKIRITEPGDTNFYPNDEVQRKEFERVNNEVEGAGGTPATGEPILQSISKASLSTDSFISAASFQQTTKVLTDAAVSGQTDRLYGLKENVILGRLIPVGSGFSGFRNLDVDPTDSELAEASDDD